MANDILYISKLNSIPFAKRDVTGYKTDENTLSHETKQFLNQRANIYFQPNDIETIQILSNLNNIKGEIYKHGVLEETINADLKIKHLDISIVLDCEIVDLENSSNLGVKFSSGNIYNSSTDLTVKETYSLNGSLPSFAMNRLDVIGKYFEIDDEQCKVLAIIYDEILKSWCIEIESENLSTGNNVMSFNYDVENYNVHEIDFNFSNYENSDIFLLISGENDFTKFYQVSEKIKVGFFDNMIELRCKGNTDKDVFYSTGIKHLFRLKYHKIIPYYPEESENQKNDNNVSFIDSQVNEGNEFFLQTVPFKISSQIILAKNQPIIFIDSVKYITDGETTTEPNEESNLMDISFRMLKAGSTVENYDFEIFLNKNNPIFIKDNGGLVKENNNYLKN